MGGKGWQIWELVAKQLQFSSLNNKSEPHSRESFPGKESTCQIRRHRFSLWVRKIPGEGNGNPLQCSFLGNPMDRGAWQATVHGVTKESDTTEWLNSNNAAENFLFLTFPTHPPKSTPLKKEKKVKVKSLSRLRLLATPWTTAHQALCPWDFPGKSTGVGCHCLLH